MNTIEAVETFQAAFARAIRSEFPEALGLIDLARESVTGATSLEDLEAQAEAFFVHAEEQAEVDGLDYITAEALSAAHEANS